jgi:Protein of unknown function (DUF3149)
MGVFMVALKELFTTPIGLLSLGTIAFILVMGAYIFVWVRRQMEKEEAADRRR